MQSIANRKALTVFLFVAPALTVFLIYIVYPVIGTLYYSLFQWKGGDAKTFVGLANYAALAVDPVFWKGLANNLKVVLTSVCVQIPLELAMGLLLVSTIKGKRLLQTVYFMPFLMSTVVVDLLWVLMYDPLNGTANQLLRWLGAPELAWLSEESTAMKAVLLVIVWQFAPFYMVLFKAALVGISDDLYEAASIDGANSWQRFVRITLPLLIPTIVTSSVLAIVGSLKTFDLFYTMTGGGPNSSTELMATYMYKLAFVRFDMGYASAVAFVMFLAAFATAAVVQGMEFRRKREGNAHG